MSLAQIRQIINDAGIGFLATSSNGQPRVRPMSFVVLEDGRLWGSTYGISGKVKEFQENSRVEICFMDQNYVQLRIEGTVDLSRDKQKKAKLLELNPKIRKHFQDENDPKFVHIEIVPTRVRWKEAGFGEYRVI